MLTQLLKEAFSCHKALSQFHQKFEVSVAQAGIQCCQWDDYYACFRFKFDWSEKAIGGYMSANRPDPSL